MRAVEYEQSIEVFFSTHPETKAAIVCLFALSEIYPAADEELQLCAAVIVKVVANETGYKFDTPTNGRTDEK